MAMRHCVFMNRGGHRLRHRKEAIMNRILSAASLALTMGVATAPAFAQSYDEVVAANKAANEAAAARTKEEGAMAKTLYTLASWSTENSNPTFACYDPTDKATCQTVRGAAVDGGTVWFVTFANKTTGGCFQPDNVDYRMCSDNEVAWGEIKVNNLFAPAPLNDARCSGFGDNISPDYLACEAALPIKS
jgi:hypothetical protein